MSYSSCSKLSCFSCIIFSSLYSCHLTWLYYSTTVLYSPLKRFFMSSNTLTIICLAFRVASCFRFRYSMLKAARIFSIWFLNYCLSKASRPRLDIFVSISGNRPLSTVLMCLSTEPEINWELAFKYSLSLSLTSSLMADFSLASDSFICLSNSIQTSSIRLLTDSSL